ncbi:MAG TPA: glycoside hydrolase family 140 protein, partial [Chitinophagaceae bacterium]
PFFWLGDTGWELFHRLSRPEIATYLENRRKKGFNVIQAVILAEFNGLLRPDFYGDIPFKDLDPSQPNEKYFTLVDYCVQLAMKKGMFMGLLPTWGDKVTRMWGQGPVIFNEQNALLYGRWLGERYQKFPNIIWILGGDRPPFTDSVDYRPIWGAMAKGLTEGYGGKPLITYHTSGGHSTAEFIHNESWLSMNTMQSGHGSGHDVAVWKMIAKDRALEPAKPTLDAEPNYEDHPVNPWPRWDPANGYFRAYDVRKQTYRSVFAGACGVTYGHHAVWQFMSAREDTINHADRYWPAALDRPGAFQAGYLRKLIESRGITGRIPDSSLLAESAGSGGEHIECFRDADDRYAMCYLPMGRKIAVNTSFIKQEQVKISWFNPRTGKVERVIRTKRKDVMDVTSPVPGFGNDWVLIIEK